MKGICKTRLYQFWFPPAFRLQQPEFTQEQLDVLEELIGLIQPSLSRTEAVFKDEKEQMARFLVDLGTGIWRIRRKIAGMKRMPKELKDAMFSLESTWDSMSEGGVEIMDYIGTVPADKEAVVTEVREVPGLYGKQVIDAISPSVIFRGEVIQRGQVVMGIPAPSAKPSEVLPPAPALELTAVTAAKNGQEAGSLG